MPFHHHGAEWAISSLWSNYRQRCNAPSLMTGGSNTNPYDTKVIAVGRSGCACGAQQVRVCWGGVGRRGCRVAPVYELSLKPFWAAWFFGFSVFCLPPRRGLGFSSLQPSCCRSKSCRGYQLLSLAVFTAVVSIMLHLRVSGYMTGLRMCVNTTGNLRT